MYWDPFDELERMHEEMDRLFRATFEKPDHKMLGFDRKGHALAPRGNARSPICHMQETENNIVASFELPGVDKSDIELNVSDNHIEIKVESRKENKKESEDKKSYSYSMQSSSFYRYVPLPKEVISEKAEAEYKDGMLRIEMPKKDKDKDKSKRLQIK